ncbi:C-terminal binding protein [Halomarina halobia]|uniref:C-terminal binding protein n=1 Tax=Halomarina halobia TaxID=3033386 RepID=A0ABD6AFE7_9EURY|nr:C-terminal binding protein [Halomarina sp. PSR21]
MAAYTVVVTDHDFEELSIERAVLRGVADVVELTDGIGDTAEDVTERLAEADGILNLRYDLDADAVARLGNCRIIARYGIGVDNIAVDVAAARHIPVTNVPDYCLEEVATHAITLVLALARDVVRYDDSVANEAWDRDVGVPLHRLSTQTVGIVGFGAIGQAVAERLGGFGPDVLVSDPYLGPEDVAGFDAELVEFEELLARSDYVTVHSPLTESTRDLFDADAFARMKDSASLINVARGPIVDADALATALDSGALAGAGLDVFPEEPPAANHPLRDHERVVTTPHVAWYSEEANAERRRAAAENVLAALQGEEIENVVNGVNV